jgi:hypothetical protein
MVVFSSTYTVEKNVEVSGMPLRVIGGAISSTASSSRLRRNEPLSKLLWRPSATSYSPVMARPSTPRSPPSRSHSEKILPRLSPPNCALSAAAVEGSSASKIPSTSRIVSGRFRLLRAWRGFKGSTGSSAGAQKRRCFVPLCKQSKPWLILGHPSRPGGCYDGYDAVKRRNDLRTTISDGTRSRNCWKRL